MAAAMKGLLAVVLAALLLHTAVGADITVGSPNGSWDLSTNMASWASSQTFTVGDKLIFSYDTSHDVLEVNKGAYDSCSAASPISTNTGGNTEFSLTAPGSRYFICGIPGHCANGMKLQVNVVAGSGSPPTTPATPSSPITPPTTPSTSTTPSAPTPTGFMMPPPPTSAAPGSGFNGYFQSVFGAAILVVGYALV